MTLDNLLKIHQLQQEALDKGEFNGLALAALRAKGYRSDKRFLVFQCLAHTVALDALNIRIFSRCHEQRNLAEYQGHFDQDEPLLAELI